MHISRGLRATHNESASTRMHVGNGAFARHFLRVPARSASARGLSFISSASRVYAEGDVKADFKSQYLSNRFKVLKRFFSLSLL